jgi:nucleoside-diphosphate-sugar epimerase
LIHLSTTASSSTSSDAHSNVCRFRCAGLYGPDRSALHTLWRQGPAVVRGDASSSVTNRIHEHDVARAIVSAMKKDVVVYTIYPIMNRHHGPSSWTMRPTCSHAMDSFCQNERS